ncbi:MAG TPA: methyltransferase domain-containing protein [Nanoarchaeota archaeon]|nr:methyltransferase domain-containing protein [Nanoarchaeota archaeon]
MKLKVFPQVYEPREDSYLMLRVVNCKIGEKVLDMGCGTGIIGIKAALQKANVLAIDINKQAVKNTIYNAKLNNVKIKAIACNLFSGLNKTIKFNKIFFNPPYIAEEPKDIYTFSWAAGEKMQIVLEFLEELPNFLSKNGKCYIIISSCGKPEKILRKIKEIGFCFNVIASQRFFFEEIKLLEIF